MGESSAELRREIAATRERMSKTIEAIAERLDPRARAAEVLEQGNTLARSSADLARDFVREFAAQVRRA
jgi:hypothetical protein